MTIGELRKAIEGLPDEMRVMIPNQGCGCCADSTFDELDVKGVATGKDWMFNPTGEVFLLA